MPSLSVPKSLEGSKDLAVIVSLACSLKTTEDGSPNPESSSLVDPKPNCKKVHVLSCTISNLLDVTNGFNIDLTPSDFAVGFVVS